MIAEEHSLARRYCLVLDELRKEAIRLSEQPPDDQTMVAADDAHSQHIENPGPEEAALAETAGFGQPPLTTDVNDINGFDASPGSSLYDMSGWGTFDSMVSKKAPMWITVRTLLIQPRSHPDLGISRICWVTVLSSSPTQRKECSNRTTINIFVIILLLVGFNSGYPIPATLTQHQLYYITFGQRRSYQISIGDHHFTEK